MCLTSDLLRERKKKPIKERERESKTGTSFLVSKVTDHRGEDAEI